MSWFKRNFCVIDQKEAIERGLVFSENIYGDLINKINCRSLWVDKKGRYWRVRELYNGRKDEPWKTK